MNKTPLFKLDFDTKEVIIIGRVLSFEEAIELFKESIAEMEEHLKNDKKS